jgi:hypothetical protein
MLVTGETSLMFLRLFWRARRFTSRSSLVKTISRFMVLLICVTSIAVLSRCGGGSQDTPLSITTPSLPNGTAGTAYSQTIQASGSGCFSWSLASGSLPHNLSLSTSTTNSITLSGTPDTEAQGVLFAISVKDSSNRSAQKSYTISILPQPDNLGLSSASFDFSLQPIGNASAAQTETLTNNGSSGINIASVVVTGTNPLDFAQSNSTCGSSLAPSGQCSRRRSDRIASGEWSTRQCKVKRKVLGHDQWQWLCYLGCGSCSVSLRRTGNNAGVVVRRRPVRF